MPTVYTSERLGAAITPRTADPVLRQVDCVWHTGADVQRSSWSEGSYTLRFLPNGADLSLLNGKAPVCDNHTMTGVEDQLGVVVKAWQEDGKFLARLQFRRSTEMTGPRPKADGLWQDILDGVVSKFSMGVELLEFTDTRDKANKLQMRTATKWRPFELSIAPIPADFGTSTLGRPTASAHVLTAARARELVIARLR